MRSRRTTSSAVVAAALAVAMTVAVVGLSVPVAAVGAPVGATVEPCGALYVAEGALGQITRIDRQVIGPMKNLLSYEQRLAESAADMAQKHAHADRRAMSAAT